MEIYLGIGIAVFLLVWKSFAYRMTNRSHGYASGHPVSCYKDQGIKPTWFDYLLCLVWWVAPMVAGWPIVLLVYILGSNKKKEQGEDKLNKQGIDLSLSKRGQRLSAPIGSKIKNKINLPSFLLWPYQMFSHNKIFREKIKRQKNLIKSKVQ